MGKRAVKRHLLVSAFYAACGLHLPRKWTKKTSEVTCQRCIRELRLAEAELEEQQRPRSQR